MKNWTVSLVLLGLMSIGTAGAEGIKLDATTRAKCLKVLRDGLNSAEFWPSIHAAEALTLAGKGKEVRKFLEPKLKTETDDQKRCGLARELSRAGDKARSQVLLDILKKKDDHGHVHAAESLYKVGWTGDGKPIEAAFAQTSNVRLRLMAAAALGRNGNAEAMTYLRDRTREEKDPTLYFISAWVLGRIGDKSNIELIRKRIPDAPDAWTKAFLEHSLANLGDPEGRQALVRNLKSDDARIRIYAAVFAGEARMVSTKAQLIKLLDDENLDARIRAAQALLVLSR